MNLSHVHKLMAAADQTRHGFLRLSGSGDDHEVRLMVEAGLIDATLSDGKEGSFTSINRLTSFGDTFLRTFKHAPVPATLLH